MAKRSDDAPPAAHMRPGVAGARGGPLAVEPGGAISEVDVEHRFGRRPSEPPSLSRVVRAHQRAAAITAQAQRAVMRAIRPGMTEGDIEDVIDATFAASGASGICFPHIVAAGPNSTEIHYAGSSRVLQSGDVMIVDIGAAYEGLCADITRTYPVSGRFSSRQRELYELVRDAQQAAADYIVPGETSIYELTGFVRAYLRRSPLRARDARGRLRSMDAFFPHSAGHYLGREVHPPARYTQPIPLGQVFTIEPGIYIDSEDTGVRVEDDYVLTEDGPWNLWSALPSEADVIESLISAARAR